MKNRKIGIIASVIFLLVCAALYIFIYTIPEITGALKKTSVIEYGSMRMAEEIPAVIVRQETVYTSDKNGNIEYYVDNNEKTRKGYKIVDIYGSETTSILCPQTGVVSFYYDGYEKTLNEANFQRVFDIDAAQTEVQVNGLIKDSVSIGDPIFKLITSDVWYIVGIVPTDAADKYQEGTSVTIEFETGSVPATIQQVITKDDRSLIVASTSKYFAEYDQVRQCTVNFVLRDDKGLIVPNSAIGLEDGQDGVYVKKIDGEYDFTPIKVINTDGTNSVVYADTFSVLREDGLTDTVKTISVYDEVLKNAPKKN